MATRQRLTLPRRRPTRTGVAALAAMLVIFGAGPAAFSADPLDDVAPEASNFQIWPEAVNATVSPQSLSVWIDVTDEGDGFGDMTGIATVTVEHADAGMALTSSFDAADLTSGTTYESEVVVPAGAPTGTWRVARVEVRDLAGNTRAYATGEEIAAATLDESFETDTTVRRPAKPEDVEAVAGDGQATLTWSAPPRDGGSLITSYTVRGYTGGDGDVEVTVEALPTATTMTGLVNGKTYTFDVVATNGEGDSDNSDRSAPVVPLAPDVTAPVVTALSVSPDGVEVGSAAADVTVTVGVADPASGIADDGVTLTLRSPSAAESVTVNLDDDARIAGHDRDATFRSVVTIPEGVEPGRWTAEVVVTDQAGNSAVVSSASLGSSGFENGIDVEAHGVPGAPGSVSATAGNALVTLTWTVPAFDGGRAISGYTVTVRSGSEVIRMVTTDPTPTATTVTGLTNGAAYTFTVAASNELGTGPASVPSDAVVPATRPGNPNSVRAVAGDREATVTWDAPASDGGAAVTSYTITVREGAGSSRVVTIDGPVTGTVIGGLVNERTYRFSVAATNRAGTSTAVLSNAVIPTVATGPANAPTTTTTAPPPPPTVARSGYWMLGAEGRVYRFGDAGAYGSPLAHLGGRPAVDLEPTRSGAGYWVVDNRGNVYAHGDANWLGNVAASWLAPGEVVTSLSRTRTGHGYWVFTSRGRVVPFGDADSYGDMSHVTLNGPVLDSIPTASGRGYYMVAADGGIFSFGDAVFHGSMGGKPLNAPVQSLVPDRDGVGYWLVASDGGVFGFEAPFRGSMGGTSLNRPVTGMVRFGAGYLMVGEDGGIFNFSDRPFLGSLGATTLPWPVVAVAVLED